VGRLTITTPPTDTANENAARLAFNPANLGKLAPGSTGWFRFANASRGDSIDLNVIRVSCDVSSRQYRQTIEDILQSDEPVIALLDNWRDDIARDVLAVGAFACFDSATPPHYVVFSVAQILAAERADEYDLKRLRWAYDFDAKTLYMSPALSLFFPVVDDCDALTLERFLIALAGVKARHVLDEIKTSIAQRSERRLIHRINHPVLTRAIGEYVAQNVSLVSIGTGGGNLICGALSTQISASEHMAISQTQTALPEAHFADYVQAFVDGAAQSTELAAAVMIFSIDRFDQMNVLLGRHGADELLEHVAERMHGVLAQAMGGRVSAQKRGLVLGRLGGAQFAIAMERPESLKNVIDIVQDMIAAFQAPFVIAGQRLYLGIRAGLSLAAADVLMADKLISRANVALYQAFKDPPGSYRVFNPTHAAQAQERVILDAELRDALSQDNLFIRYMPMFDLSTGLPVGAEALVRWNHPEMGLLSPELFIPMAEESGVIADVGDWVLGQALREFAAALPDLPDDFRLSVNISAEQFRRGDLEKTVFQALYDAKLPRECLILELTETLLVENLAQAQTIMQALRNGGVRWSIDDFGTGFSSLSYLSQIPFDEIKLDRRFVQAIAQGDAHQSSLTLIDAVIAIGRSHDATIVAEGIESDTQIKMLRDRGCDYGQGYAFCEPMSMADLTEELRVIGNDGGAVDELRRG